jgi:hypothetical protein
MYLVYSKLHERIKVELNNDKFGCHALHVFCVWPLNDFLPYNLCILWICVLSSLQVEWQSEQERRESKTLSHSSGKDALYIPVFEKPGEQKTESVEGKS